MEGAQRSSTEFNFFTLQMGKLNPREESYKPAIPQPICGRTTKNDSQVSLTPKSGLVFLERCFRGAPHKAII